MKTYYLFDHYKIQDRRERIGRTQKECAQLCDVAYQQWQRWEGGITQPNADAMAKIALSLDLKIFDLHMFYEKVEIDDFDERQLEL